MSANLACEQALLLRKSREVTREPHAKRDVSARGGERKEFSFSCFPIAGAFSYGSLCSPLEIVRELKLKRENLSISKIKQDS